MKRLLVMVALVAVSGCSSSGVKSGPMQAPPGYAAGGPAYENGGLNATARQDMASGDVAAAAAGFGQAVDVNPFDPIALNNLAVAKTEAGQFHEAQALLERAERLAPQNTEVAANLARLRNWNQNYAMQGGGTLGPADDPAPLMPDMSADNLPPPPPPLWDTRVGVAR